MKYGFNEEYINAIINDMKAVMNIVINPPNNIYKLIRKNVLPYFLLNLLLKPIVIMNLISFGIAVNRLILNKPLDRIS